MVERSVIYFVSDVHLGLEMGDPAEREARFVRFLRNIPADSTKALYMLGDIWDFWYEYRDVVPRTGVRVVAALIDLMDAGVEVWFCVGNHDIWCYSYFESLGMHKFTQPYYLTIAGKSFCLGHGDALGGCKKSYGFMLKVFHCRPLQRLFSTLHPWIAFRIGLGWSNSNRRKHTRYHFAGSDEPLYRFALQVSSERHLDLLVFGHFHDAVDTMLPSGARLIVLKDWMEGGESYGYFNGLSFELHSQESRS